MKLTTLFDLRWLTKKYYKKKGYSPLDISQCDICLSKEIKTRLTKTNSLFLGDSQGEPYALVIIKDWNRVVGVNQAYHMDRLRKKIKTMNGGVDWIKFILISNLGFSESIKSFARKNYIILKSAADMQYEYPVFRRMMKKHKHEISQDEETEGVVRALDSLMRRPEGATEKYQTRD